MSPYRTGATARLRLAVTKPHGLRFDLPAGVQPTTYSNRLRTCAKQAGLQVAVRWMGAAFLVLPKGKP